MYLGIDLGTSSVKAVLVGGDDVVASATSSTIPIFTQRGVNDVAGEGKWSEQDPMDWWNAVVEALQLLRASMGVTACQQLAQLRGIAVDGQMHGLVMVDGSGTPLARAPLWNDSRCVEESDVLNGTTGFTQRASNLSMPGFTAAKFLWAKNHQPQLLRAAHKVMLPKDFIVYKLTGLFTTDLSDAAGTVLLNQHQRTWDETLIDLVGVDPKQLPSLHEGCDPVGTLDEHGAAAVFGDVLPAPHPQVVVAAGAADNAAGALGARTCLPGTGFVSLGTSGVVLIAGDHIEPDPPRTVHCFCHCIPASWYHMTVTLSAASALSWFASTVGRSPSDLTKDVEAAFSTTMPTTSVLFLPYLSGERSPLNDPHASGSFFNLTHSTTQLDLTLAVMEGVAFSLADAAAALGDSLLSSVEELQCIGGGAASPLWCQLLSDSIGVALEYREGGDRGAAFGAAKLAELAYLTHTGQSFSTEEAIGRPSGPLLQRYTPTTEEQRLRYLQRKKAQFRKLYECTKDVLSF